MDPKTRIRRHSLLAFFTLTYAITWSGVFLVVGLNGFNPRAIELSDGILMFCAMFLGPSLSSLLLTVYLDGRAGLRRLFQRITFSGVGRRGLIPLLIVPILSVSIFLFLSVAVSPVYRPSFNIVFGLAVGAVAGFFEELGWTGFAAPRLLARSGAFKSGLILGLTWAVWHMAADFWGNYATYGSLWLPYFILYWILPLSAYRILMTYAYRRSNSLLQAQLMHMFYTGTLATVSPSTSPGAGLLWQGIFAAALWLIVSVVAWRDRDREAQKTLRRVYTPPGVLLCAAFLWCCTQPLCFPG